MYQLGSLASSGGGCSSPPNELAQNTPLTDKVAPRAPEASEWGMAEQYLKLLLETRFGDPKQIARRLRVRFGLEDGGKDPIDGRYDEAAANWVLYLVKLESPSNALVTLAGRFLSSRQFTYWAEHVITDFGDFQVIRNTRMKLAVWSSKLRREQKELLKLEEYYEFPYKGLSWLYETEKDDDSILPWLPLIQLGFYYFDLGKVYEMKELRTHVANGLCELLGEKNCLVLKARSDAAFSLLYQGDLLEAHEIWTNIAAGQTDTVLEKNKSELYRTRFYIGMAQYLMNDYTTALSTLTDVANMFLGSEGPMSHPFLTAKLWSAQVRAARGELQQAKTMMEDIRQRREEKYGYSNGSATLTLIFLSDIYRRLGEQAKAIEYLQKALRQRKYLWPIDHPLVIDVLLRLAITFRDFGLEDDTRNLLRELEQCSHLEEEDKFYSLCQTRHLKALLLFEDGDTNEAILIQWRLLANQDPSHVIRPLQWIRTDLADMLRHRNHLGDEGAARVLFDGLIIPKEFGDSDNTLKSGLSSPPDCPRQLELAEKALKLCRSVGLDAARDLLSNEGFRWRFEDSLWQNAGMPAADPGAIRVAQRLGGSSPACMMDRASNDTENEFGGSTGSVDH